MKERRSRVQSHLTGISMTELGGRLNGFKS